MILNRFKSKKNDQLRSNLKIVQIKENIAIVGMLSNQNYYVHELLLISRKTDEKIRIGNKEKHNSFSFNFNLKEMKVLEKTEEDIFDLFLITNFSKANYTEEEQQKYNKETTIIFNEITLQDEHVLRLGRFKETETEEVLPLIINERIFQLYKTVKGGISLTVNNSVQQEIKTQIDSLKTKRNTLRFKGKIFTRSHNIKEISLLVKGREYSDEMRFPVKVSFLEEDTKRKFGLNRYTYDTRISLEDTADIKKFNEDVYDAFFDIEFENNPERRIVRIGKPRFKARHNLKSWSKEKEGSVLAFTPYYTFRLYNLSFQVKKFDVDTYKHLKKTMRWSFFNRLLNKNKKIWLIGERPEKAEDTGYHFFKYMRTNYPEKNVYYVIDKDSPNLANVLPYGNVLYFNSKQHIKSVIAAERVIGSHHPDYLFPLRTKEFEKKVKAKKVFLQHGVMGTKNMIANYGKNAPGFDTDLFLVSSQFEREMIINDFGYDPRDVKVTGLSRFDELFKQNSNPKKQLLIIPTWREWLVRDDIFLESEYYNRYKELVFNERLHALSKKHGFEIVFCLHPNMRRFASYFDDAPVRVIDQGEVDVQVLLKESSMMITDYSSVAFDFSFLNKPIIYYQFDRDQFIGQRGSHLDLDNDLPGDIVFDIEEIAPLIEEYAVNRFEVKEANKIKASRFLSHKDQESSARIYNVIKNEVREKSFIEKIVGLELSKTIFKRYRKSKFYFPTMKLFYNIARRVLPVDKELIVFESGIGRQYADSPRNIYEEIVRQNLDYKKVWISNQRIRFQDVENTKRIQRLSPSYYYYLARAKHWVNNQNFPTYIKKRKDTTYLQTWHGTPLKKMLYDIENITGRSDDYLERVSSAVDNWDFLISPSEYATNAFRSAFKYNREVLEVGYPRNDIFFRENSKDLIVNIRRKLNIGKDDKRKIILYAPTFRDNQATKKNHFTFNIEMDLAEMERTLGDDYIVLLRMHVVIKNKLKIDNDLKDFVKDVSNYSDMQELLLASDVLITDYSSVMFDFANTNKPMLFFTYDFDTYRDDIRGFYMDFEEEAPGPLLESTNEIIDSVQNLEKIQESYMHKYYLFREKYCGKEDGKASQRVVEKLFKP